MTPLSTYNQLSEEVIEILNELKQTISENTDIVWTRFNNTAELLHALDAYVLRISEQDMTVFKELACEFAPTGSLQELSISNGWGMEFIKTAEKFDEVYQQLNSK